MSIDILGIILQTDLRAICEQAGAVFDRSGFSVCPLHGSGKNRHQFHLWTRGDGRQMWTCFGDCGASGDVIDFVMRWRGLNFKAAVKYLVEYLGGGWEISDEERARLATERAERAAKAAEEAAAEARKAIEELRQAQAWLRFHEQMTKDARRLWRNAGVPDWYQDWVKLGYTPVFSYWHDGQQHVSSALSIPHYGEGWQVEQIAMRLLEPVDPKDKYRPYRPNLPIPPFLADPDTGWEAENVVIAEGQKKAIVGFVTLDNPKYQFVGVSAGVAGSPGRPDLPPTGAELAGRMMGRNVIVCFDPDAREQGVKFARATGARYLSLSEKLDDLIVAERLKKTDLASLFAQARRVQ